MKKALFVFSLMCTMSHITYAQLLHPLGLGSRMCERIGANHNPRMHVEGNMLNVCTNQGIYSKDLLDEESTWQLVGFKDIPLQDYARRGDDILALRYNVDGSFLLLSHDGGKTFEDVTPEMFEARYDGPNTMISLVQNPQDPEKLLISSYYLGVFQSSDFGRTWHQLTEALPGTFIGYHPGKPEIIYCSGNDDMFQAFLNVSYDDGRSWASLWPCSTGDNCSYQVAFQPTEPEKWVVGGQSVVLKSADNGLTWDMQSFENDTQRSAGWIFTAYDNEDSNIIYMAGRLSESNKIMYSADGGSTWSVPHTEQSQGMMNDFLQYKDKLLLYNETDVYEITKKHLSEQGITSVKSPSAPPVEETSETYDLQGRRIKGKLPRGIYIKDGKKVIR